MERNTQYKHAAESVESLRNRRRYKNNEIRKEKRERVVRSKRFRHSVCEDESETEFTKEQIENAAKAIQKKGKEALESFQLLRRAFAAGSTYIDMFLSVDNALQTLVGQLTGKDTDLQLAAAWCLTNISAGTHEHAMVVVKLAAPYLTTYLDSGSNILKDQCAYAIGNLAGDSQECREILHSQGCVPLLVKLLESSALEVAQYAAFALSNISRESTDITRDMVKCGVVPIILKKIKEVPLDKPELLAETAWLLTYLTASGDYTEELIAGGVLSRVVEILTKFADHPPEDPQVMTPLLRTLGNISSGPDEYSMQACENPFLLHALENFLMSSHRHIIKETLWVLSNMTGEISVCSSVAFGPLLPIIIKHLDDAYDIKTEAAYLLCNMGCHGTEVCTKLVAEKAIQHIIPMLKSQDIEMIHLALSFCEMALRLTESAKFNFESSDGVGRLEGLEYHSNEMIRKEAHQLLDTYFLIDEEKGL
ncbi:importin subunit alpha-4-like [Gigantopelta aegis]|uniref:importin subunit alpha-4-like n=1 Tax=Gigantopelta aegis TaxID=1735272 RepID=UPI001B88CAF5|nr:importin subunit alpha-4-like [Gigantopelta aegis]